jgi:hypothetical protein
MDCEIIASSKGSGENDDGSGIITGHAYAMIEVYEPKSINVRLLKLRNPWG